MVSQRMLQLGTARSVIRELFEYGRQRAAEVGAENVFDFSLGNPSVPAPAEVNDTAIRLLREQADTIHCYTSAPGDPAARQRIADSLNRRFGEQYTADELYLTVGAAASLCCVLGGLTCPGDEYILFAPYFPEYRVFIEGVKGDFLQCSSIHLAFSRYSLRFPTNVLQNKCPSCKNTPRQENQRDVFCAV